MRISDEEARMYWGRAEEDEFFYSMNEFYPYTQEALQEIIERYGEGQAE